MAELSIPVLPTPIRWSLVLAAVAAIAWGSLVPSEAVTRAAEGFPYGDEGLHTASYAALALTITYAWLPSDPRPLRRGMVVFAVVFTLGVGLEGVQSQIPGRTPDVGDAVADMVGASMAFVWDALVARFVRSEQAPRR